MTTLLIKGLSMGFQGELAKNIGLNEAIILQQVLGYVDQKKKGCKRSKDVWIENSYSQWKEQFTFWSEFTIKRAIKSLEKQGLLLSKGSSASSRVKHYKLNYPKLKSMGIEPDLLGIHCLQRAGDQNDRMEELL